MKPIFVIEKEERFDDQVNVGVSFEKGNEEFIIEALYQSAKHNSSIFSMIEVVHSRLKMTAFGYGGKDSSAKGDYS